MTIVCATMPSEIVSALTDYLFENGVSAIPEDCRETIRGFIAPSKSPVDATVQLAELVYARAVDMPEELRQIGLCAASIADTYNFHNMASNGRAKGIADVLKADYNVTLAALEAPETPPEPLPEFAPPSADPAPEPAPPEPAP